MSTRKVTLVGRGPLSLTDNDHMATGGEGSVYKKAGTVIKVYTDSAKMKRDGMGDKIRLLSKFQHDYIVSPQNLVLDEHQDEIGYYMTFAEGEPLSRVFTNDFRRREKVTDKDASTLVDRMHQTVRYAHDHQAIMVDANELNWLAAFGAKDGPKPRVIDVDSWVLSGKVPATVPKMLSIRDWHGKLVSIESDWFAWGIVTFQVFTGIHPYKGMLDGYKPADLEKRMKDNASVFTPGVRLNTAVRDFACIPGKLLDWYQSAFQGTERSVPPSPFDTGVAITKAAKIARVVVTATGKLSYDKLFGKVNDPAIRIFPCGAVLLSSGLLADIYTKREIGKAKSQDCEVVKVDGGWIKADKESGEFVYSFINNVNFQEERMALQLNGRKLLRYENRLFLVTDNGLTEFIFMNLGKPLLSAGNTWGVMVNSTRWYDGVGIQDAMGAMFVIAPFGDVACGQIRIPELDGLTAVGAKAGNRFISIMTVDRKGDYQKIELSFDASYKTYKVSKEVVTSPELNVAILPKGVCATIVEDGELIIFVPTSGNTSKVADKAITTEMSLSNLDNTVVYLQNGNVWKVAMNKN